MKRKKGDSPQSPTFLLFLFFPPSFLWPVWWLASCGAWTRRAAWCRTCSWPRWRSWRTTFLICKRTSWKNSKWTSTTSWTTGHGPASSTQLTISHIFSEWCVWNPVCPVCPVYLFGVQGFCLFNEVDNPSIFFAADCRLQPLHSLIFTLSISGFRL